MYSADGVQDAGSMVAGQGITTNGIGTGDDIYWARVTATENGIPGDFDDFAANGGYESRALVSGYFYAMVFQDNNIQGKDWYYYTPMVAITDVDLSALGTPQGLEMNTDLTGGNAIDAATKGGLVGQVIPEPATMLLFGIGGFGAWLLRRRQQA